MKSLNKSFISKRKKRKLLVFSSSLFSMFAVGLGLSLTSSLSLNKDSITSVNSNLNALNTGGTTTQSAATFTVASQQTPLNKKANEVTNSDIQNILTPSATVSSYNVVILPVTETNINKGYVNFLVYQTYWNGTSMTTAFANASQSMNNSGSGSGSSTNYQSDDTIQQDILNKYGFTSGSTTTNPNANNVFSTAKINNLANWITADKYNIEWKSDEELKSFITNSTATTLTTEMLVNNFFSNTTNLPDLVNSDGTNSGPNNQPSTTITITSVDKDGNGISNGNDIGLFKIEIKISQTSKLNWLNDNFPTGSTGGENANGTDVKEITITKYIGGFNTTSGQRYIVDIDSELQTIRNWTISDTSLFDGASATNNTVSSLIPSQFESPYGGKTALISLFSTGTGLTNNSTVSPIVQYSFTGDSNTKYSFYDSTATNNNGSTTTGTGLIKEINDERTNIKITDITTIANDVDGSLRVIIKYDGFSIYSGTVVSQTKTYDYVAGTFATSTQPENLLFSWKDVNTLSSYGLNAPSDIVNQFMRNRANAEFVRVFTNQFINASSEIKALNRTATILFGTATGEQELSESNNSLNDQTGLYSPAANVSGRSITVRLTFENWNGSTESKIFQQSFTFSGVNDAGTYSYDQTSNTTGFDDSLVLTWLSNQQVLENNASYASTIPSTVIYNIVTSSTSNYYQSFITSGNTTFNPTDVVVSFEANDVEGSLTIFITKTTTNTGANIKPQNAHVYSQLFTGFRKTTETTGVVSFNWIPNEEVSGALQSIPVNNVTKEDIIEHYLSNSALFQNGDLGTADITLTPNINENSLTIEVTMSFFNQDSVTATNRTFATKLTGFATYQYTNSSSFTPPKNMTAVFAISAATVLSITLGVVLMAMLLKRARLRNFKSYHDSVLEKKVKKHTRRTIK